MSEATPPDKKIVFRSDMKAASQQTTDYFAEQNKKSAEKKQKDKKVRKKVLIIGGIVALIVIVVVVVVVVLNMQHSGPTITDDGQDDSPSTELSGAQNLSEQATEIFEPTYTVDENGDIVVNGDLEASEAFFAAALANPANKDRINTIYLAQIIFYASLSDNQRVIEISKSVDSTKLNTAEKVQFYNTVYLAYAALGDAVQADFYYHLTREASSKIEGIGG